MNATTRRGLPPLHSSYHSMFLHSCWRTDKVDSVRLAVKVDDFLEEVSSWEPGRHEALAPLTPSFVLGWCSGTRGGASRWRSGAGRPLAAGFKVTSANADARTPVYPVGALRVMLAKVAEACFSSCRRRIRTPIRDSLAEVVGHDPSRSPPLFLSTSSSASHPPLFLPSARDSACF